MLAYLLFLLLSLLQGILRRLFGLRGVARAGGSRCSGVSHDVGWLLSVWLKIMVFKSLIVFERDNWRSSSFWVESRSCVFTNLCMVGQADDPASQPTSLAQCGWCFFRVITSHLTSSSSRNFPPVFLGHQIKIFCSILIPSFLS